MDLQGIRAKKNRVGLVDQTLQFGIYLPHCAGDHHRGGAIVGHCRSRPHRHRQHPLAHRNGGCNRATVIAGIITDPQGVAVGCAKNKGGIFGQNLGQRDGVDGRIVDRIHGNGHRGHVRTQASIGSNQRSRDIKAKQRTRHGRVKIGTWGKKEFGIALGNGNKITRIDRRNTIALVEGSADNVGNLKKFHLPAIQRAALNAEPCCLSILVGGRGGGRDAGQICRGNNGDGDHVGITQSTPSTDIAQIIGDDGQRGCPRKFTIRLKPGPLQSGIDRGLSAGKSHVFIRHTIALRKNQPRGLT